MIDKSNVCAKIKPSLYQRSFKIIPRYFIFNRHYKISNPKTENIYKWHFLNPMQPKSARNPKLCANIAIISTAILLGYLLIQRFFIPQDLQPNQTPNETAKGKKISLPKTVWNENQKALLLVLQKGFKFCTKIMPFYESTVEKASEKGIKLIAVLPNSREESQQYLKENGMEIREIRQA